MFTLYLLGLCFWPPWRDQCNKPATYMVGLNTNIFYKVNFLIHFLIVKFQFIDPNVEDDNFYSEGNTSLVNRNYWIIIIKFTCFYKLSQCAEH